MRKILLLTLVAVLAVVFGKQSCALGQDTIYGGFENTGNIPTADVQGKKLIAVTQKLHKSDLAELPQMVKVWQDSGYDGICVCVTADPTVSGKKASDLLFGETNSMVHAWWRKERRSYAELKRDVDLLKDVEWGRLTDNFLWAATFSDHVNPNWFDDEGWEIVLDNTRLAVRITKEVGFVGILLDCEAYSHDKTWKVDHARKGVSRPLTVEEVQEKVRERGRQWAQAVSADFPEIVIAILSMYEHPWLDTIDPRGDGKMDINHGTFLKPAFIDGLLLGLHEKAKLVNFTLSSYVDSRYENLARVRNECKEQSMVVSTVPELARRRISYSAGLWTDAGFGHTGRFSPTDVRVNHRDPERHKHATHNALATSDHYVWHWSENGPDGIYSFLTTKPTPLMRQYWQANIEAHQPQDLQWVPALRYDTTDYSDADAEAAKADAKFWKQMEKEGFRVVADMPEFWKFFLDTELLFRWSPYNWSKYHNDNDWLLLKTTSCWQSQGIRANDNGLYRVTFDAPAGLDGEKQEIVLGIGHLGRGAKYAYLNGTYVSELKQVIDISEAIKPGEPNLFGAAFTNRQGPGGLMGQVKLLVRDRKGKQ
jgi:hypothetical protein